MISGPTKYSFINYIYIYIYCKNELISHALVRAPSHGRASIGRPARTYLLWICTDTEFSLENLPEAMDSSDEERERVRGIIANRTT